MELNEKQRLAVQDTSLVCAVKANVGSGKTTVLTEKIKYLHEELQVPYEEMMVLTFTNKAANEILQRLHLEDAEHLLFGTFHRVAYRLLKEVFPVEELGYTSHFAVYDEDEEMQLLQDLMQRDGFEIKYKNRLKKRVAELRQGKTSRVKDDLPVLLEALQQEKRRANIMNFDDLLERAIYFVENQPERMQSIRWLLVDEAQDCDELQYRWMKHFLDGKETHVFVVGDPNQMIYGFRGGWMNIFFRLVHDYDAVEMDLMENYRSNATILEAATYFKTSGASLAGVRPQKERIRVRRQLDPLQEAFYLVDRMQDLRDAGVPYEDIAILYRYKAQGEYLEKHFAQAGIPYEMYPKQTRTGMEKILQDLRDGTYAPEVQRKDAVSFLTLHASKGLEFSYVFILGINDGMLPMAGAKYDAYEEEMRLFYVGMTRSKEHLELTYYENPTMPHAFPGMGKFIKRLPQNLLDFGEDGPSLAPTEEMQKPAVSLQELRRMMKEG